MPALPAGAVGDARPVAVGAPGGTRIAVLDCRDGSAIGSVDVPAGLAAAPVLDASRGALYFVSRDDTLARAALPRLEVRVRVPLSFAPSALAVASGADGVVLAGGSGRSPLSAHAPDDLAMLHRYALPDAESASVADLRANPARQRFTVAFASHPLAWEIAWNRDAPPVLQGLVHDYRMGEAVPLPGRFTPRAFKLDTASRRLLPGALAFETGRLDANRRFGVVNLDVRREIERPALASPPADDAIAAWRDARGRGWLAAAPGASRVEVIEADGWKVGGTIVTPGEVLAIAAAPDDGGALVAHRDAEGRIALSRAEPRGPALSRRVAIGPARLPLRFVEGDRCTALVDADGRWLAGVPGP